MPVFWRRILIFFLALIPLVFILVKTIANQLGADPAKTIVLFTGEWAIYFLFITLAVTPLRRLISFGRFHFRWLQVHRRMLGLFALFYAGLHVLAFLIFILGLDFSRFGKELVERPYILVSIPAVILLVALGITSTKLMMRRLGKYWLALHQSIYLIVALAWVHVFMQVRSSYFEAVLFAVVIGCLLGIRLYFYIQKIRFNK